MAFQKLVKEANNKEIALKSIIFFIFKIGGFFLGYLFTILITRNFDKSVYGLVTLGFTLFMIFSVVSKLGFDINLTKIVSSRKYKNQQILKLYLKAGGIAFLAACLCSVLLVFFKESISNNIFQKESFSEYLFWIAISIPCWTIILINSGVLRGLKKNTLFSFFSSFSRFGFASLMLLFYIAFASSFNPIAPIIIHFITVCFLSIVSTVMVLYFLKENKKEHDTRVENIKFSHFFKDSTPILMSSVIFIILSWVDRIFIGIFESEADIAIFDVAAKVALIIGFSLEALNSILAPKVSELYSANKRSELIKTIQFSAKINTICSLGMFAVVVVFSEFILSFFGEGFESGKTILIILAIGQLFNCLSGSVGVILQMTGNQKKYRKIMIYALISNLTLNFFLIEPYGVIGVAIATASSMIIWNLIGIYLIRKHLSINPFFVPIKN